MAVKGLIDLRNDFLLLSHYVLLRFILFVYIYLSYVKLSNSAFLYFIIVEFE